MFLGFLVVWMVKRKMLAVDERLAEQLAKVARDRGQTLYSLVNEILEQALKVYEMGLGSLKQLVNERCVLEAARGAGFVLTVKTLWFDALERAFNAGDQHSILERWRETGEWYGKYFLMKEENPVVGLRDLMCNLMWGTSEFAMEVDEKGGEIRCLDASFPSSYTELLSAFLEGAMEALGYECADKDVSKGAMRVKIRVKGEGE